MMVVVGEERKGRRGTGNVRVLCMLCMVCGEQEGWLIENEPRRHCSAACPSHYTTTPHHTTPPYHPPPLPTAAHLHEGKRATIASATATLASSMNSSTIALVSRSWVYRVWCMMVLWGV